MILRAHPPEHSSAVRMSYGLLYPTGTGKALRLGGRTSEGAPCAVESLRLAHIYVLEYRTRPAFDTVGLVYPGPPRHETKCVE